eukprot:573561-Prymnesium_polylepis.1
MPATWTACRARGAAAFCEGRSSCDRAEPHAAALASGATRRFEADFGATGRLGSSLNRKSITR